jgi:hypothetical protein
MLGDMHNHFKDLKLDLIASAANDDAAYTFTLAKLKKHIYPLSFIN